MLSRIPRTTSRLGLRFQSTRNTKFFDRFKLPQMAYVAVGTIVPLCLGGKLCHVAVTLGLEHFFLASYTTFMTVTLPVYSALGFLLVFETIQECISDLKKYKFTNFEVICKSAWCATVTVGLLLYTSFFVILGVFCACEAYTIFYDLPPKNLPPF